MKISAVILAKNEERKIGKTIKSLSFCDEVIVVDDESSDATVQIAQKTGVKVLSHSKKNEFGGQRNWAMEQAKNDWILFVDADEDVSENLKSGIENLKLQPEVVAYSIPRRDFFWDTELKYGETKTARTRGIIRLVKKGGGVWIGAVHERYVSSGKVGKLDGYLNHHSHDSVSSFIQDINTYSTIRAAELASQGIDASPFGLIFIPFGKFIYTYFILGGFLDGPAGFVYSFVMSFHSFLVRAKLITKSYV